MDWHSRKILTWWLSNSIDADFCVEAMQEALVKYGKPEIFNTPSRDIAAQYPAGQWIKVASLQVGAWIDRARRSNVRFSMDGTGRFLDNIFVKRL